MLASRHNNSSFNSGKPARRSRWKPNNKDKLSSGLCSKLNNSKPANRHNSSEGNSKRSSSKGEPARCYQQPAGSQPHHPLSERERMKS